MKPGRNEWLVGRMREMKIAYRISVEKYWCHTCGREKTGAYRVFGVETWRQATPGRPKRGLEGNVNIDGEGGVDGIDMTRDRNKWRSLVNSVMNFRVP
jgi:hypothetical protein